MEHCNIMKPKVILNLFQDPFPKQQSKITVLFMLEMPKQVRHDLSVLCFEISQ